MCRPDLHRVGRPEDRHLFVAYSLSFSALTMPSSKEASPRRVDVNAEYYYRRPLGLRELLPAVGVAVGAGLFAFYITKLLLQRTPLRLERPRPGSLERSARR